MENKEEIIKKKKILKKAQEQLKKEFVGIDHIIDQVIASCSSWFLMPEIQDKPVIVNLWGMTGVGKSSLVNRLVQLLDMAEKYYRFDLGDKNNRSWDIDKQLSEVFDNENGFPIVLAFDEFQHIKSLNEFGVELEKQEHRVIWDILDSGKYMTSRHSSWQDELYELIGILEYALLNNVKVEKGLVVSNKKFFKKNILKKVYYKSSKKFKKNELPFIDADSIDTIYQLTKEKYKIKYEVEQYLFKLNGYQTVNFIKRVLGHALSPKVIDCSKALIFVMGNLDNAYSMCHNNNPDIDADEFHQESLKINITHIKKALQYRFRNEQIARLGNNHIIYPALSRKSFQKIIHLELNKVAQKIKKEYELNLIFDQSIHKLIYNEGVFPTQGTRPVFTTIHQIVKSKLGNILINKYEKDLTVKNILLKVKNNCLIVEYKHNEKVTFHYTEPLQLNLEKLRASKKDDFQALVAVHECGHAVLNIILLKLVPQVIFSQTVENGIGGFNYTKHKKEYTSKKELIPKVAVYLGGLLAEKLIFGDANITTGAQSDIVKATAFTTSMLKNSGMGKVLANYQVDHCTTNDCLHDTNGQINKEVEFIIQEAQTLALTTLNSQRELLVQLSNYLSENSYMKKDMIKDYVRLYAIDFNIDDLDKKKHNYSYRNQLKQEIQNINNSSKMLNGFSLNKEMSK